MNAPSASRKSSIIGVNEAIVAYLWWGFVTAMYYKQLDQFPPMELLTGRVLGGVPLMLLLIALPFLPIPGRIRFLAVASSLVLVSVLIFALGVFSICGRFSFLTGIIEILPHCNA